jgi:phosphatidylinositol-3-phosphatase
MPRRLCIGLLAAALVACTLVLSLRGEPGTAGTAAEAATPPCGSASKPPAYTHIVVIAFENHSYQSVLGNSAPSSYFKTLAAQCGSATAFRAASFPHSLPNYLAATGGSTGSITGDCLPKGACRVKTSSIFQQLGSTRWLAWNESMPSHCDRANASPYVVRHNPAVYYTTLPAADCRANDLAMPSTLSITRAFTWITPNLNDDLTKGTPATAGAWLQNLLTGPNGILVTAPYTSGNTAVFVWFDSAAKTDSPTTPIPLIVIAPSTGPGTVSTSLTDYSLLRTWEDLLGLPCLGSACSATGAETPFNL